MENDTFNISTLSQEELLDSYRLLDDFINYLKKYISEVEKSGEEDVG